VANHSSSKKIIFTAVTIFFLLLLIVSAELCLRHFFSKRLMLHNDERNLVYQYDKEFGWFPIKNSEHMVVFNGHRIYIKHNTMGFRDHEHSINSDKPRIVFLGDSVVWGYSVNQSERFTDKLRNKMSDWDIYNLGVSGYGTDQEYILISKLFEYYKPTIVFLVYCNGTDQEDNLSNVRYGGYYKPYFIINRHNIELRGVPVPKSINYFFVKHKYLSRSFLIRLFMKVYYKYTTPSVINMTEDPTYLIIENMNNYIGNRGAELIIGIQERYIDLEKYLKKKNIKFVNLDNSFYSDEYHWTPEGHTYVSNKIYDFLKNMGYLDISE
jgi:lysophospholipase L1-like esterase